MITIHNLTKKFGRLKALDSLSVTFDQGKCIALIGPNGCGKTTLIKSILGMVVPERGSIDFKEHGINGEWHYRQQIGYMPQIGRYPDNMTIHHVFEMMKDIRKNDQMGFDEDLIEIFKLNEIKDKKMHTLSGGTRQKVSAALAFLFNPDVVILDEPTAGLDPLASGQLKEKIILELSKGKLILITSHVLSELDDLVSDICYLQDGKVLFYKKLSELIESTGENKLTRAIAKVMTA